MKTSASNVNKKEIFTRAWAIAREAAANFGGSSKSYFAESLKLAYADDNTPAVRSVLETLVACGGKEWIKDTQHRVYVSKEVLTRFMQEMNIDELTHQSPAFNRISDFAGGSSNKQSHKSFAFEECKAWFNAKSNKFESKKVSIQTYLNDYVNANI